MTEKNKHPKREARRAAIQALYQWKHNQTSIAQWKDDAKSRTQSEGDLDEQYLDILLTGLQESSGRIESLLQEFGTRRLDKMNPVELSVLSVGIYELMDQLAIPYRVVINESIELCKEFGSPDGHRYINAVLNASLETLRPHEVKNDSVKEEKE